MAKSLDDIRLERGNDKSTLTEQFENLAQLFQDDYYDEWFRSKERQAQFVEYLAKETGCKKITISLVVRLMAPMACKATKSIGGWAADSLKDKLLASILNLPKVPKILQYLNALVGRINQDTAAKNKLREEIFKVSPSLESLEYQYSTDMLGELAKFDILKDIKNTIDKIFNRQPFLILPNDETSRDYRFQFMSRFIRLVGRDEELAILAKFLAVDEDVDHTDNIFRWAAISGLGGVGKSRIALELAIQYGGAFNAGFLKKEEIQRIAGDPSWSVWQPSRPTLFLIDFAGVNTDVVANLLSGLANRSSENKLIAPVRILLIERHFDETYWANLTKKGDELCHPRIQKTHNNLCGTVGVGSLHLDCLKEDDVWSLISSYLEWMNATTHDRQETLKRLKSIDPEMRPLYAKLLADALTRDGNAIENWDRKTLVENVLHYEISTYWSELKNQSAFKFLFSLATAVEGMSFEDLQYHTSVQNKKYLPAWDGNELPETVKRLSATNNANLIPPVKPDILGSVFVLETIGVRDDIAYELRRLSIAINPGSYFAFLKKLSTEFPLSFPVQLLPNAMIHSIDNKTWDDMWQHVLQALKEQEQQSREAKRIKLNAERNAQSGTSTVGTAFSTATSWNVSLKFP